MNTRINGRHPRGAIKQPSAVVIAIIVAFSAIVRISHAQPSVPTGLTATPGGSWVTLNWNASSGAVAFYQIKRWTTGSATNVLFNSSYTFPTATSYTDFGVGVGTNYFYAVSATGTNGVSSANSNTVTNSPTGAPSPYVHPSGLHTLSDFTRMATNVAAGNWPWIGSYIQMTNEAEAQLSWGAAPAGAISRSGTLPNNYARSQEDALAIYYLALEYRITGNTSYATAAINIMNAWSGALTNVTGNSNAYLASGLCGYEFAAAAEVLHGYSGWSAASQNAYKGMLLNVFYALNHDFLIRHNGTCDTHYWCNWDACNMASMIAIGVFCDNTNIFNEAVTYFENGLGNGNMNLAVAFIHPDGLGQWQESGRDQAHTKDGLASEASICQIAWNNGVDLYGYNNNLYLRGLEYVSKYNLYNLVPYVHYQSCDSGSDQTVVSSPGQGSLPPMMDMVYSHYVNIKGLAAPYTAQAAAMNRPDGGVTDWNSPDWFGFTSLTCYINPIAATNAAAPSGLQASVTGTQAELSWWGSAYATSYNVQRSTVTGGPYTTIGVVGPNNLYYVDTGLTPGTDYYYVVSANNPIGVSSNSIELAVTPNNWVSGPDDLVVGGVIGTLGSYNNNGTTIVNVFAGTTNEFFDAPTANGNWAGLDLGTGVSCVVTNIKYFPRIGLGGRMVGGMFQAANDPNFASPVTLFTISAIPPDAYTSQAINNSTAFRYLRYLSPDNGYGNVAEVNFEGPTTGLTPPLSPTGVTAVVSNQAIYLSWVPSAQATSYNIKRSTTSGGPYIVIENMPGTNNSENIPGTNFTDASSSYGTNYYVVTALNFAGESGSSAQVAVDIGGSLIATNVIWSGTVSGNWDTTTLNWLTNSAAATYQNGDPVLFDDSAAGTPGINVSATVTPVSMLFNNSSKNYSISGSGIAGTCSLTMLGGGTLTIGGTSANTYSGGTVVNAGTLELGNNSVSPLGTGAVTLAGGALADNGTVNVTLSNNIIVAANTTSYLNPYKSGLTLAGNISGAGNIVVGGRASTDSYILSGMNSGFTGTLTVNNSSSQRFAFASPTAGSANAAWVFNSAGTDEQKFTFGSNNTISFGSMAGGGWLRNDGGASITTLRIGDLNTSTVFSGLMVYNGSSQFALLKVGAGTLKLTGADSYNGLTTVSNGELIVATAFTGGGSFAVKDGAALGVTNLSAASATIGSLTLGVTGPTTLEFQNVSNLTTAMVSASSLSVNGSCTVQITGTNNLAVGKTYPLLTDNGTMSGFGNLSLQMPAGFGGTLVSNANQISVTVTLPPAPAIPLNLVAVPGNAQVNLSWSNAANATGYNLKRSLANGGPYAVIAMNYAAIAFTNSGLLNGTNYFYAVSATNSSGESVNSVQASARPTSAAAAAIAFNLNNGQLQLNWPADHTGWRLQSVTNLFGTNWVTVANSTNANQIAIPAVAAGSSTFFRLIYP